MSASEAYLNALTRLSEAKAQTQAEAARASGQIWGNTIANIGQMVAQYPEQQAKLKEIANRADLTNLERQKFQNEVAQQQRAVQSRQQISQAISSMPLNADGTYDVPGFTQQAITNGGDPDAVDKVAGSLDNINKFRLSYAQQQRDQVAGWADNVLSDHRKDEPVSWDAVHFHVQTAPSGFISDADKKQLDDLEQQGIDPTPLLKAMRSRGTQFKPKPEEFAYGSNVGIYSKNTGEVKTPTAAGTLFKTPNEVKIAAADPTNPHHDQAMEILKNLPASETVSAAAEDERYRQIVAKAAADRTPDERAWAAAYEKQKTLGIDTSASFAAQRQAATQAQQNEIQARSQGFTERQTALKDLKEAEKTYNTGQSGVDTLRATIQAAAKGNVTAASQQSLLTTMATLKAEGFNRINTAEIGSTKDAGSLVQNIEGWFGKKIEGQPIPESVQRDMLDYADILQKAAYQKYLADFNDAKRRYGPALAGETPKPPPTPQGPSSVPPPSAAPTPNLRPNLQRRLGGK